MESSQDPGRAARLAVTRATFRNANNQVAQKAVELDVRERPLPFVCECDDAACRLFVRLTLVEYEDVRADATQFVVVPGHEAPSDRVLQVNARYVIVAAEGEAGDLAAGLDV